MDRIIEYIISKSDSQISAEQFLRSKGFSSKIMSLVKKTENGILINNKFQFANRLLNEGDILRVKIVETEKSDFPPLDVPLNVVYEDDDILVINKPALMPIHPSMNNYDNTLGNACCAYFKNQGNFVFRCINRLDRDTSGLTIIAKNPLSGALLSNMQLNREIKRTYLAIVEGKINEAGQVNAPIARKENSVIERTVDFENGDTAITNYEPIASNDDYTLLLLSLETGRTHQIRVHMSYINHPLPGDFLYNPDSLEIIKRQALHSYRLKFNHPITGEIMDLTCPYPNDMEQIFPFPY